MNEKEKQIEEIAFSRCDVPERTKRFALQYVSEAYAGIKNCRECEFYNTCDRIDSVRAELRKKKKEGMKNMTEQETREKIFNIIREFNVKKRRYSTHTEPSDDDELADALIAAGIGDLKEHRIFSGKDGSIKQLYSVEEVEKIVKERKELKDELRSKVEYIHEQDEVIKEYKHRAEVAERALKSEAMCHVLKYFPNEISGLESCMQEVYEAWIYQAEKELAAGIEK